MILMIGFAIILLSVCIILALEIVKLLGRLDGIDKPDDGESL